jgi:hypothetical protein
LRIEGTEMECPVSLSVSLHLAAAASGSGSAMLADVGCVVVVVRRCRRATDGGRTQHDASRCEAKVRRGKAKQGRGEGRVSRRSVPSGMYNGPGLGFVYSRTGWGARRCRSWREESKSIASVRAMGLFDMGAGLRLPAHEWGLRVVSPVEEEVERGVDAASRWSDIVLAVGAWCLPASYWKARGCVHGTGPIRWSS